MNLLDPLTSQFWIPVGVAVLCGGIIGLERQLRGKPAGVRTSILICLGTQLFVHLGGSFDPEHMDPSRIVGQVVTGVGFLGAGVMFAQNGTVLGVTTAAVIWILAAIGSTIGLGHYTASVALSLVTVCVLTGVELLEASLRWLRRGDHNGVERVKPD